jgi:exosortase
LLFRLRGPLTALPPAQGWAGAALVLAIALLFSFAGRLLDIQALLMLSLLLSLASVLWLFKGLAALRLAWFPIVFLIFAYPLPYELVLWLTGPLKEGVSAVAAQLLSWLGFPVGHSGVVITIGQYQLLVLEACAGLQTMFTLEAMGLLYASLMNHQALARNLLLALVVVPISFVANVVRVMVLALITYEFGDAAGQGFLHGFAGVLLFLVALCLIVLVDDLLGRVLPAAERRT